MSRSPLRSSLLLVALSVAGCDGLFNKKPEAEPTPAAPTAPVEVTTAKVAGPSQGTGPWKVIIAWNKDNAGEFQVPEGILEKVLEPAGVKILRSSTPGPVSVLDANGQTVGTVDVGAITDLDTAWILAESGRPPTFLAPLPAPILVQQAGAYFKIELPELARPAMRGRSEGGRGEGGEGEGMRRPLRRTNEDGTPAPLGGKGMKARPKLRGPGEQAAPGEADEATEDQ